VTTAPVVSVAPAAGTAVGPAPHEEVPPAVGDVEVPAGGDGAPVVPLAPAPAVAALVDPPVHGWVMGGGATGAAGGGELVVVVVPAGGEAPAVGAVVGVVVVEGGVAGVVVVGGGVAGVTVVVVTGAGAADVGTEPPEVCPTSVAAGAVPVVAPDPAAAVVAVAAPTAAVAEAATHRVARSTEIALTVTARRCCPNPAVNPSVPECMLSSPIRYPSRTVRVTVCRCPAPSSAANRRTSVATPVPHRRRVGRRSLITLCGLVICDSVS
jgi:hypothetical protein